MVMAITQGSHVDRLRSDGSELLLQLFGQTWFRVAGPRNHTVQERKRVFFIAMLQEC